LRKNTRKVFEKKYSKYFREKSSVKVSEKYLRNFFEKFPRKKYSKSLREKIFEKFSRINSQNLFDIFCGPILGLIEGPRVKFKNRGLSLKTNKNKSTQVGLSILGPNMEPKNRAFQYRAFLTSLILVH
jgi:hypothetical protein